MSKSRRKKSKGQTPSDPRKRMPKLMSAFAAEYRSACRLAVQGNVADAKRTYDRIAETTQMPKEKALLISDRATLEMLAGHADAARAGWQEALQVDPDCEPARANLAIVAADTQPPAAAKEAAAPAAPPVEPPSAAIKVAVISFLFNWPSSGGGIVHTVELCQFLARAGYDVRHFYVRYPEWFIGNVAGSPITSVSLDFSAGEWNVPAIKAKLRDAVTAFDPDQVIIMDAWNMKPHLARALCGFPTWIRFQALELLCPLNNIRLLMDSPTQVRQCSRHQLATPHDCWTCLQERGRQSGLLHQRERELAGVGAAAYQETLLQALAEAEGALTLNPLTEAMLSPYVRRVVTAPWGMDPARFPWSPGDEVVPTTAGKPMTIFQAGIVDEPMKGYSVLHEACGRLRQKRRDFTLVVTGDPPGDVDEFTRFVGWKSQTDLPRLYREADIVVVPTIAQEGLSRTSAEAMAAGRPVVGSRIGGLPYTIADGATGLLCEPGKSEDLAAKLTILLYDATLRQRMGLAGRRRFEEEFAWPVVIERHFRPLLTRRQRVVTSDSAETAVQLSPPNVAMSASVGPAAPLGCVLAIHDRPAEMLARTFQTYAYQETSPVDKVLLDYGSEPAQAADYEELCREFGWRYVRVEPAERRWNLSAAFNLAFSALHDDVEVVFKSDIDILLGQGVLSLAARLGKEAFCQFPRFTTPEGTQYPLTFTQPEQVEELFQQIGKTRPSAGFGQFACPLAWLRRVGGFDLAFQTWGYEDNDLRCRAEKTLPVVTANATEALLMHQHHPPVWNDQNAETNRPYFEQMRTMGPVVRNGGRLLPPAMGLPGSSDPSNGDAARTRERVVFATRSMDDYLYRLSGEFLHFESAAAADDLALLGRVRLTGTEPAEYFRRLLELDCDWVVNVDEDAFMFDPSAVLRIIRHMRDQGYGFCGMPDGGVVEIRQHNPVACNAFFNIFDVRRCHTVLADWPRVLQMRHQTAYETDVPEFARRGRFAFDHYEPYYGLFFGLRAAGERCLYLDAREWDDGTSTVLQDHSGAEFLIHAWYARQLQSDQTTRLRYRRVVDFARRQQRLFQSSELGANSPTILPATAAESPSASKEAQSQTLACVHVYDRFANIEKWLRAWQQCEKHGVRLAVIHNRDSSQANALESVASGKADFYIQRANIGQDVGAFQDVIRRRSPTALPEWDQLVWFTDDFLPLQRDFLGRFLDKARDPSVGLVAARFGYWPGHFSFLDNDRHCRTVGFLIKNEVAQRLRFPAEPVTTREQCLAFEHRGHHLMDQVLSMGYRVELVEDADARLLWDTNHEDNWDRWSVFDAEFPDGRN